MLPPVVYWFWCQAESYIGKYVFNTHYALRDFVIESTIALQEFDFDVEKMRKT